MPPRRAAETCGGCICLISLFRSCGVVGVGAVALCAKLRLFSHARARPVPNVTFVAHSRCGRRADRKGRPGDRLCLAVMAEDFILWHCPSIHARCKSRRCGACEQYLIAGIFRAKHEYRGRSVKKCAQKFGISRKTANFAPANKNGMPNRAFTGNLAR